MLIFCVIRQFFASPRASIGVSHQFHLKSNLHKLTPRALPSTMGRPQRTPKKTAKAAEAEEISLSEEEELDESFDAEEASESEEASGDDSDAEVQPKKAAPKRKAAKAAAESEGEEEEEEEEEEEPSKKAKGAASKKLAVGENVATVEVTLLTEDDKETTLNELTKDTGIVIFMYPRANTPGCTKQACGFKDNHEVITKAGFQVFGMSFDKPKSQKNWQTKFELPYSLLTDAEGVALKAFGAFKLPKNVIRSHVVIAQGGELLDVQNQISPGDSFSQATEFVKSYKK